MPARFDTLARQLVAVDGNDMFPLHRGARLTVETVKTALLLGEQGSRQTYVDVLRELVEGDPHMYSICSKLTAAIANAPYELMPACVEEEDEHGPEHENAEMVCEFVSKVIENIPRWRSHVRGLLWAFVFANSIREIIWRRSEDGWGIDRLEFIHTRRVAYNSKFEPYIVDAFGQPTGVKPRDPAYKGKFIFFEPRLSDEYPTREGVGRVCAYWLAFKRFAAREFVSYVESRGKPLMDVSYAVGDRAANDQEVEDAQALAQAWSAGSTGGGAHPSTITATLIGPGSGTAAAAETPHKTLIDLCDAQNSKATLGGTLTTDPGERGARSLGDTQKGDQEDLVAVLAREFDETLKQDLVSMIVELNFGPAGLKYTPRYHTKVEPPEDDKATMETVGGLVDRGQPVKAEWVSQRFGIPLAEPGDIILSKDGAQKLMRDPEEMAEEAEAMKEQMAQAQGQQDPNAPENEDDSEQQPASEGAKPPAGQE